MDLKKYLDMQKKHYEVAGNAWTLADRDHVVGSYDAHNNWKDYDTYLFKDFDTKNLVAIEYGCGPGRNIIKYIDTFKQVDGVDIARSNLDKALINIHIHIKKEKNYSITGSRLFLCDGKSIPVEDESYDVVFSVICLQHIACYDIRFSIFKDIKRILKPNGYFCFQMGFNGKHQEGTTAGYYENAVDAEVTNGGYDVRVEKEEYLIDDLVKKLGFINYKSDIRPTGPGDNHKNWIWAQVQKRS